MPKGIKGFQKGHSFYGNLSKPNYFKKGHTPWNKGKIGVQIPYPITDEIRKKRSELAKKQWEKGAWGLGFKGQHHTEEVKNNLKLRHLGKRYSPKTEFKKGHPKPINACKFLSGENHWNWRGGITPENKKKRNRFTSLKKYKLWREAVFTRDNWTCQKYGTKGGELHPHHIQNFAQYPELIFVIGNGITLSAKAHIEFHSIYGKTDNTKEQLDEFLGR